MKIVIVGGVAGGATAAAKARRDNEHAEIVIYERGPYVSFANCGLPYFIGGEITDRSKLLLMNPESFWEKYRVNVLIHHEVTGINRQEQSVSVRDADGNIITDHYDQLILAQGAQPLIPPISGSASTHVFSLRDVPQMDAIDQFIHQHNPQNAVIVGAGFIGLEMAEAFHHRGLNVTVVERLPQVLPPLDQDIADEFASHLPRERMSITLGAAVSAIHPDSCTLDDDSTVPADIVLLAAGVRPEIELAKTAGLTIGDTGGVVVDGTMRSSDPRIFAIGDAAETVHRVTNQHIRIPLAGPANRQGRVAGANAAGGQQRYRGALGTSIVRMFDRVAGSTGLNQRQAEAANIPVVTTTTRDASHAGYYPGASTVIIKLVVQAFSGEVLGGQVIGDTASDVDKRVDVIATAIAGKLTAEDLGDLDLAYAPPFGSAKDPINQAGTTADNIVHGRVASITTAAELPKNAQLIDVRNPNECTQGMIAKAINIPVHELRHRHNELDNSKPVVVYCAKGLRGYLAQRILKHNGFDQVFNLTGGFGRAKFLDWETAH